jgi:unsaturated rhamnogalacturonyl hydrolase
MQKDSSLQKEYIVNMMHKVADWQLNAWNTTGFKHPKVDWTNAAAYTGLYAFGSMKGNDKYLDYLVGIGNDLNWNTGKSALWPMIIALAKCIRCCILNIRTKK